MIKNRYPEIKPGQKYCTRCRLPKDSGKYHVIANGKRQQWVCSDCDK